jgi:hypothetical protein
MSSFSSAFRWFGALRAGAGRLGCWLSVSRRIVLILTGGPENSPMLVAARFSGLVRLWNTRLIVLWALLLCRIIQQGREDPVSRWYISSR